MCISKNWDEEDYIIGAIALKRRDTDISLPHFKIHLLDQLSPQQLHYLNITLIASYMEGCHAALAHCIWISSEF